MTTPIHHMTTIRYYRGRPGWDAQQVVHPEWDAVEAAIRRMDNYCYPIVQLDCTDAEHDEATFNVVGGDGRWALFHMMGEWQYEDPSGSEAEAELWASDQGYFCQEKNILHDVEKVLRITRAFYETGSYAGLSEVE